MARREQDRPRTLEEAVAQLKRDPLHPIRIVVDGVEIELRRAPQAGMIAGTADQSNLGDKIAALGPWEGESTEELVELLRDGRDEEARKLPDLL